MKQRNIILLFLLLFLGIGSAGFCEQLLPKTEAEAQFVRRIVACWKDKEHLLVRSQVKQFSQEYPESQYLDSLWAMLGDLEYSQECFEDALFAYNLIKDKSFQSSILIKKLDTLHQLQKWSELSCTTKLYLPKKMEEIELPKQEAFVFYYAEALHNQAQRHCLINKKHSGLSRQLDETAKQYYEILLNSSYREKAHLRLAEIHISFGNEKRAAELYLSLCKDKKSLFSQEDLLMQAAHLQDKVNPEAAIKLYSEVVALDRNRAGEAFEKKMHVLFSMDRYLEIIAAQEEIAKAENPRLTFIFIQALCALDRYEEAFERIEPLLIYQEKQLLLTAIHCAQKTHNHEKLEHWVALFERFFSHDSDFSKALYYLFLSYKEEEQIQKAEYTLARLMSLFPEYREQPTLYFEYNLLQLKQKKWEDCRQAFRLFISKYPHDELCSDAFKYLIHATWKEFEELQSNEKKKILCHELFKDITLAIDYEGKSDTDQRRYFQLQLAKLHYLCQEYEETIALLDNLSSFDQNGYQIHLLLALSHRMISSDLETFIHHAQKALEFQTAENENLALHHHLFTAFILLAKEEASKEKQQDFLKQAAEHLYSAIQQENLCTEQQLDWLGKYFYNQIVNQIGIEEEFTVLKEPKLQQAATKALLALQKMHNHPTDEQIWRMSQLYGWQGKRDDQILLLEQLIKRHSSNQNSFLAQIYVHLAMAEETLGNSSKALKDYQEAIKIAKERTSYEIQMAKLQYARLCIPHLKNRSLTNSEVLKVLGYLQEVKTQKKFTQEPLHLEAAIDHAFFQSSFAPKGKGEQELVHLLIHAKQEFTSLEDISSKNYQECRKRMPDKEGIYQAYLLLIDAHIANAEAKIALEYKNNSEQEIKKEIASELYQKIAQGKYAVSRYLIDQAKMSLQ